MHLKMGSAGERNGSGVQSVSVQVVARVYTVQAYRLSGDGILLCTRVLCLLRNDCLL